MQMDGSIDRSIDDERVSRLHMRCKCTCTCTCTRATFASYVHVHVHVHVRCMQCICALKRGSESSTPAWVGLAVRLEAITSLKMACRSSKS